MGKMRRLLAAVLVASMLFGTNGVSYAAETIADDVSQETTEAATEDTESVAPAESDPSETVDAVTQTGAEDSSQDDSEAAEEVTDTETNADDKAAAEDTDTDASETEKANYAAVSETGDAETPESGSSTEAAAEATYSAGKLEFNGDDYGKDYSVTLSYDADAEIPADAQLKVTEIEKDKELEKYEAYLKEANAAVENSVTDARFFDIKIMVGDEEIQPKSAVKVNISYKEAIEVEEKAEVQAVHFDEEKDKPVPVEIETNNDDKVDEVEFEAKTFSVYAVLYTVDFNYTDHAFSIPGGSNIRLSDLAQELGFYAESETKEFSVQDVAKVTFTNPELVKVENQADGDWMLTSLKAFSTKEKLTIDMTNGDQFVVDVTDAQGDALTVDVNLYDYNDSETKAFPDNFGGQDERLYAVVWAANRNSEGKLDSNIVNVNENGTPWAVVDITDNIRVNNGEPFDVASFFTSSHAQGDTAKSYANLTDDERDRLLVRVVHTDRAIDTLQKIQQWGKNGDPAERAAFEDMWNGGFDGYELSSHHASGPAGDDKYEVNFKEGNTLELDVTLKFDPAELEAIPGGKYYIKLDALSMDGSKHYYYFVEATADGNSDTVRLKVDGNWTGGQKYSKNWQSITPSVVFPAAGKTITEGGNLNEGMYLPATVIGNYTYEYEGRKTNIDTEEHVLHDEFTYKLTKTSFDDALTPDDILGDAVEFGIVADTYKQTGHSETNYAVKKLSHNANTDVCGSGTGAMPFYVSNVIENTLDIEKTSCPIDLFIPEDQDSKLAQPHINDLKNSTFTEPEAIAGEKKLTEYNLTHEEIEKYVQDMIDAGKKESEDLSKESTVKPVLGQNEKTVDTTQFPDGKTIYVDCSDCKDTIAADGWIIKKLPNQSIVFNIPGENVTIGQFTAYEYNESGTELRSAKTETDAKDDGTSAKNRLVDSIIFDHISFNAYQAKTLHLNNTCALFLAPLADRVTQSNGAGWILAKGTVDSEAEWHFYRHNRHYTAKGDFELAGQKKIVDKNKQEQDYSKFSSMTFSFELYKCNEQGKVAEGAKPVQTLTAGKDGKFKFNKLKYTHTDVPQGATKDFYYVIKEVIPKEDNDKGVTYDADDVYIKVKASDSGTGEISFVISKGSTFGDWTVVPNTGEGDNKVYQIGDFKNTVEEEKGSLRIEKKVTGTTDKSKEFTFAITLTPPSGSTLAESYPAKLNGNATTDAAVADGIVTVTLNAGDNYEIFDLPVGTQYSVTEKNLPDGYTEGTHTGDQGTISKNPQAVATMNNTYAASGKGEVKVQKVLNGRPWTTTDAFEFTIERGKDAPADEPMPAESSITITDKDADHIKSFGEIGFTKAGTYTYVVKETKGTLGGVTYDETEHKVTIKVKDKGNGELIAEEGSALIQTEQIKNTYAAAGEIVLNAQKKLSGARKLDKDQFIFELIEVIDGEDGKTENVIDTKKNDEEGKVAFDAIGYTQDDIYEYDEAAGGYKLKDKTSYEYRIREVIPDEAVNADGTMYKEASEAEKKAGGFTKDGYTYDGAVHTITVELTDNGDGTIDAKVAGSETEPGDTGAVFTNAYDADGTLKLDAEKTFKNGTLKGGEFTFELMDADGKVQQSKKNDAAGNVSFDMITYKLADVEKAPFTYTVREVPGNRTDVKYDETVYTVTVELKDKGDGTLEVTKKIDNGGALKFVNEQLNVETSVTIGGVKVLKGRTLKKDEFKFVLADADGKWVAAATNDAEGNFTFKPVSYKLFDLKGEKAKVYTYSVWEVKGSGNGITYDEKVYTVKVTVTDNGDGTMTAKADKTKSDIKFVNREEKKNKTGDEAPLGVLFGGLGIGAAGLAVLLEDRKRRNRNR